MDATALRRLMLDEDGNPLLNLLQYYHRGKDFKAILNGVKALPKDNLDEQQLFLGREMSGLPRMAACRYPPKIRAEIRAMNKTIEESRPKGEPGIHSDIGGQNYWNYPDVFSSPLAHSPVLTKQDLDEMLAMDVPKKGYSIVINHFRRKTPTEIIDFHFSTVGVPLTGTPHTLETIWNLSEEVKMDPDAVATFFGESPTFSKVPDPTTPFGICHRNRPTIGPQDVICAWPYVSADSLFANAAARMMRWTRDHPPWDNRYIFVYPAGEEAFRNLMGHAHLRRVSKGRGAEYSNDIHDETDNCANNQVRSLFPDDTELQNLPLHELMVKLAHKAEKIYFAEDLNATPDDFFADNGKYVVVSVKAYLADLEKIMMQPTLRIPAEGNPACGTTYFVNGLDSGDEYLEELIRFSGKLELKALREMAAATSKAQPDAEMTNAKEG
ncbi:hypothetical protein ACCS93_34945 [Rhizobium ruizarguesonis]